MLQCSYPVKNQDRIDEDRGFILPNPEGEGYACNLKAIQTAKLGQIEKSEAYFEDCIREKPELVISHLNRLRLYFLLEEFKTVKAKIEAESPKVNSRLYVSLLEDLHTRFRWEERVIVLDALSRVKGWELYAFEELANYYTTQGNLAYASSYWNQILEVNPFYEEALYGMIEIQTENGKWHAVLDYAKSLSVAAKKNKNFHYFYAKANFELGRYEEALRWIEKANPDEKSQISFLEIWRDCLLLSKDQPNWEPLLPYYKKIKSQGYTIPESIFFPTLDPSSKELRRAIRSGRQ
jgi:tetratricopeptide (TPR) repeat protein